MVVVKYARKPLSNKTLFAFTEPFGCLREHLVLNNKVRRHISTSASVPTFSLFVTSPRQPQSEAFRCSVFMLVRPSLSCEDDTSTPRGMFR